mmetsp:Transcript_66216/g.144352  ORF Transcript_66216/g.144352 Transcript_66216/m.144352 type:complete len:221 (-) Transcript_66216:52-714(-)
MSDAVVHERAMVVHVVDTDVAHGAVVSTWRTRRRALAAEAKTGQAACCTRLFGAEVHAALRRTRGSQGDRSKVPKYVELEEAGQGQRQQMSKPNLIREFREQNREEDQGAVKADENHDAGYAERHGAAEGHCQGVLPPPPRSLSLSRAAEYSLLSFDLLLLRLRRIQDPAVATGEVDLLRRLSSWHRLGWKGDELTTAPARRAMLFAGRHGCYFGLWPLA